MSAKPTLALLHGWGMNPRVFDALGVQLQHDCTLLPLALPGHGGAQRISDNSLAGWVAHIATQLPLASIVLGWSLGGQVAMRIALDHATRVSRLILISTTPKFVATEDWSAGIPQRELEAFGADLQAEPRATLLRFMSLQTRGAAAQKTLLHDLRASLFAAGLPDARALQVGLDILLNTDLRAEVGALSMPACVIHGSLDKLTPPAAGDWLARHLSSTHHTSIAGAAHAPFLSHTQQVAASIRSWLHG